MADYILFLPKHRLISALKPFTIPLLCALIFGLAFLSIKRGSIVFLEPAAPALQSSLTAPKECKIMEIDSGRFRLEVADFSNEQLRVQFQAPPKARYLMIRKGYDILGGKAAAHIRVSIQDGESIEVKGEPDDFTPRYFIPLPLQKEIIKVVVENLDSDPAKLVIDEMGLYRNKPQLGKGLKHYLENIALTLGLSALLGILLHSFLEKKGASIFGVLYFLVLPIAVQCSVLLLLFSPEWARDLRIEFTSGPALQEAAGCNLNYGLYMASSILQGKGPLIVDMPPWCRMPGYGFILALAGYPFDMLQMAMNSVLVQMCLFALSVAFFFWAALRIMPPFMAGLISTVLAFLPIRMFYLQIESMMPAVIVFCSGAACLFCSQYYKGKQIPLRYHILLHSSFAFWFFLRTDVLPAWALISLAIYGVHWRSWKYFLIPIAFVLAIGLPWAFFKMPFTGEFSMTTNSIGASMMVGLWEIPHQFIWPVTDGAYFSWITGVGLEPGTKAASDYAVQEVFRFCFTYPVYVFSLIWHKFLIFAQSFWWSKYISALCWIRLYLMTIIVLSFVLNYKRFQTFLLSWPIFLNVPVFFLFYSSLGDGRFYNAPTACLLIAALSLLLDPEFYRRVYSHLGRAAVIIICMFGVMKFGPLVDDYFIKNEKLRYWAPFLDPTLSTLNVVEKEQSI